MPREWITRHLPVISRGAKSHRLYCAASPLEPKGKFLRCPEGCGNENYTYSTRPRHRKVTCERCSATCIFATPTPDRTTVLGYFNLVTTSFPQEQSKIRWTYPDDNNANDALPPHIITSSTSGSESPHRRSYAGSPLRSHKPATPSRESLRAPRFLALPQALHRPLSAPPTPFNSPGLLHQASISTDSFLSPHPHHPPTNNTPGQTHVAGSRAASTIRSQVGQPAFGIHNMQQDPDTQECGRRLKKRKTAHHRQ